ncbi:MAG: hypothetical protein II932_01720 [Treponema sp.]|nr:hypothetical protein [Treponema sp.]
MSEKTRLAILIAGTVFIIIIGVLLVYGWFVLLMDAMQEFSIDKLPPLVVIPLAIVAGVFKWKRIWLLSGVTGIMNRERQDGSSDHQQSQ